MKKLLLSSILTLLLIPSCTIANTSSSEPSSSSSSGNTSLPEGLDIIDDTDLSEEERRYYNEFYNHSSKVELTFNIKNQHAFNIVKYGSTNSVQTQDIYHPASLTINVNDNIKTFDEVGLRLKGNMSREDSELFFKENGGIDKSEDVGAHFKVNFACDFDDNPEYSPSDAKALKKRRFGKAKKFDMKWNRNYDPTFSKEAYASYILEQEGLLSQKINIVKVTFNTESDSRTMYYQVLECIDKQYLTKHLGEESVEGNLYKCGWDKHGNNASLTASGDALMGVEDKTQNKFYVYDLKTNDKNPDHTVLKNLINTLTTNDASSSQDTLKTRLASVVDMNYFVKFAAMEWIIGNPDSWRFDYNNIYLYFNSKNNLMYPIMFDNDRCFGIMIGMSNDTSGPYKFHTSWPTTSRIWANGGESTKNPLYSRVVCDKGGKYPVNLEYQKQYVSYCKEFMEKYLDVNKFKAFTEEFYYLPSKDITLTSEDNTTFATYVNEMKDNILNCYNSIV